MTRRLRRRLTVLSVLAVLALGMTASFSASGVAASGAIASAPKRAEWKIDQTSAGSFNVVSCASTHFCMAAGTSTGTDYAVEFNGTRWETARTLERFKGEVVSLSCPTVGWCVAVTDLAGATVLKDGRWSKLTTLDPNPGPPYPGMANAVSCTSSHFCAAVDGQGSAETFNGTSWTKPQRVDLEFPLTDVSCGSSGRCVAVDGDGHVVAFRDGHWSAPKPVDTSPFTTISCVGSDFCVAIDLRGRAVVFTRSGWSRPTAIDSLANAPIEASCPQQRKCVAVDSSGRMLFLSDHGWTAPALPKANPALSINSLVDVSCPIGHANFCAAVDASGDAWTTNDAHLK
ncbi:MAG: hypothetical protein ACRD4P_17195 [Bryobacteraceae bacterium]